MKFMKALAIVVVLLVAVSAGLMLYMGVFSKPSVEEKVMGPYLMAYEPFVGAYKDTGKVFDKVTKALKAEGIETTRGIGIYYDDPTAVPASELKSDCGSIVEEKDYAAFEKVKGKYQSKTVTQGDCLVSQFPIKNMFSYFVGPMKCYPVMSKYAESKGMTCGLVYELYDMPGKTIYFVREITAKPNPK